MIAAVKPSVEELLREIAERDQRIAYLEEQLAWLKRQLFGKKSEQIVVDSNQLQFEFAGMADLPKQNQDPKTITLTRKLPEKNG